MGILARGLDDVSSRRSKHTNTYSFGDVVQHKASGEKGIIVHVYKSECENPDHAFPTDCMKNRKCCQQHFIDLYNVSISFEKTIKEVNGNLFKRVLDFDD